LGDFIDRGPENARALAIVRNMIDAGVAQAVLGNHELKGPEIKLPVGNSFADKDGHQRRHVRLAWWLDDAKFWAEAAISMPEPGLLPASKLPAWIRGITFGTANPPVFFGHYWMSGDIKIQSSNTLCLDYSAGSARPLLAYSLDDPAKPLNLDNISRFGG